jgi:hypothetical protein
MAEDSKEIASERAVENHVEHGDVERASQLHSDNSVKTDYESAQNVAHMDFKLVRKLDLNLLPWLCLLYLASFLDRTNIGNAKIFGLQRDLNMSNGQWQVSLAIFFISYSIFEPMSNVLLKKIRPSIYLSTL